MSATEAQQMIGAGQTIKLVDGSNLTFVFTMLSLARIEEEFGLDALANAVKRPEGADPDAPLKTSQVRMVTNMLALALPEDRQMTGDELLAKIPLQYTSKAMSILTDALDEAFPKGNREQRRAAERAS